MTLLMLKFLPVQHLGYNDPFISNPDEMRTLCSVVQGSTDINNFLYQTFCNIVSTSTDITLGIQYRLVIVTYHGLLFVSIIFSYGGLMH
jgi:hypothetical protein